MRGGESENLENEDYLEECKNFQYISFRKFRVVGGGCIYDNSVSLTPNLFDL